MVEPDASIPQPSGRPDLVPPPPFLPTDATTGGAGYDPDCSRIPVSQEEILLGVWGRDQATPLPEPGDVVLYRAQSWGDVVEAQVVAIQDYHEHPNGEPDANIWYRHAETGEAMWLHDDPWPALTLDTVWHNEHGDAWRMRLTAREARVRGAVGWLPAGWDPPIVQPEHLTDVPTRCARWQDQTIAARQVRLRQWHQQHESR